VFRLVSAHRDRQLRAQLPQVEEQRVQQVLQDPALILFSDAEMPPAYQDWSSGLPGVHSPDYNISANGSEPYGNGNVEFPWGTPAGTHRAVGVSSFRFLWLPTDEAGRRLPVVWYRKFLRGSSSQGYAWTFPVGTVVGEVLRMRAPDGKSHTFEIRLREREYGEWAVDVFRPFPTAADLAERIKALRPQWEQDANLKRLVDHLEKSAPLKRHILADANHSLSVFRQSMGIDTLPPVGDDDLVIQLLNETPFRSALGQVWRTGSNGTATAAPTTLAAFHVVPRNYDAGFIEVDRVSCQRCHETVNRHVNDFEFGRDWYGRIRGSDGIFSFHPFSQGSVSRNGYGLPVRMNQRLVAARLLERFDRRKHSGSTYQLLEAGN
jgi:hypothetical protein